jgi:acetyltransferase-like isoleucine patch superfamily enzyme
MGRQVSSELSSPSAGPFRTYPRGLEYVREALRFARLRRAKSRGPAHFTYGNAISLARGADVRSPHYFELGDHVSIGKNFTCEVDTRIGSYVLISSNVSIIGNDHPFTDRSVTVYEAPRLDDSTVEIGSDVLIGFGTIIVGTVRIGSGCIVGAGSVVVRDLPPYTICAGVPAKPLKPRYLDDVRTPEPS